MKRIISIVCMLLCLSSMVHAQETEKKTFWQKIYMPLELGMSISSDSREGNALFVSTSLEYRQDPICGMFYVIEYDEHTHSYKDRQIVSTNVEEGDICYMDMLGGVGWRQPLCGKWAMTALAQVGPTRINLKDVQMVGIDGKYVLLDNVSWCTSCKTTIGLEYNCSPLLNLFFNIGCLKHLTQTPLEIHHHKGCALDLSLGFNCPLF